MILDLHLGVMSIRIQGRHLPTLGRPQLTSYCLDEEFDTLKSTVGRLRSGMTSLAHFELLKTRFFTELEPAEQRTFGAFQDQRRAFI